MKLIDLIASKNAQDFKAAFEERMAEKVVSAIEQEKILVAQSFFNIEESVNEEVEPIDELDKKTLQSYIRKKSKVDPENINVAKATKKIAAKQPTSTLQKKLRTLRYKSPQDHKNPFEYDAVRGELKNRGIHYFGSGSRRYEEVEPIDVESINELDQKTLKSYIRKKSKVDPENFNIARAAKKIAAKQPTSTLQKKLRTLRNKPPQEHKTYGEYDAVRDELKNRGIHYFGSGSRRY